MSGKEEEGCSGDFLKGEPGHLPRCSAHVRWKRTGGASIIHAERTEEPYSQQDLLLNEGQW